MYVYLNFIEIQLIYNAVLVSSVQQSDSALMRLFKKNSLCLFLLCCPVNKFFSTIFLDSIYMC